jgi:inner membrane protein
MASLVSHAVAALGLGAAFFRRPAPGRILIAGTACAVIPDFDVIGFRFGIHYGDFWGHRGFTHSLFFAALLAGLVTLVLPKPKTDIHRSSVFVYLFVATASHAVLDAMTNGGLGIAFFSPFDNKRYFLPWRPIRVSPIGITRFFTSRGFEVLRTEFLWIWLPSILLILVAFILSRPRMQSRQSAN